MIFALNQIILEKIEVVIAREHMFII
jgi:hypothetical protein